VGQTFGMMIGRRAPPVWASTHVCSVTCSLNVSGTRNNEGPSIKPALATKKHPKLRMLGVLSCCLNLGSWPGGGVSGDGCRPVGLSSFKYKARSTAAMRVHAFVLCYDARSFAADWVAGPAAAAEATRVSPRPRFRMPAITSMTVSSPAAPMSAIASGRDR
jgi:hypothetical protein